MSLFGSTIDQLVPSQRHSYTAFINFAVMDAKTANICECNILIYAVDAIWIVCYAWTPPVIVEFIAHQSSSVKFNKPYEGTSKTTIRNIVASWTEEHTNISLLFVLHICAKQYAEQTLCYGNMKAERS